MKNTPIFIMLLIALTALMPQLNQYASGQVVVPPLSPLKFKQVAIEVKVVNTTYADIMMKAEIVNPSNQTLTYTVEINTPQPYVSYPFAADKTSPQPKMEIKVVSEKIGELKVTIDRYGNARATGSIEAKSEDAIHVEGWTFLAQTRRLIWRESIDGYIGFSIRPETGYRELEPPERSEAKVKFTYPAEYTKTDEASYKVEYLDGFKIIEYTEGFYGSFGLSFNTYRPRTPINSLTIFSGLWAVLVAFVIWTKRKKVEV